MPTAAAVVVGDEIRKGNKMMDNTVIAPVKQKALPSSSTGPWVFRNRNLSHSRCKSILLSSSSISSLGASHPQLCPVFFVYGSCCGGRSIETLTDTIFGLASRYTVEMTGKRLWPGWRRRARYSRLGKLELRHEDQWYEKYSRRFTRTEAKNAANSSRAAHSHRHVIIAPMPSNSA